MAFVHLALQLDLSKLRDRRFQPIGKARLHQLDTHTSCRGAGHWIRLGGLDCTGRYVRDPAVILIERAHQSLKCNTHTARYRGQPLPTLPRHALPAHFVLTSVKRDLAPRCVSFFFFLFVIIHRCSRISRV